MTKTDPSVTALLERWQSGDDDALERLAPMIYRELQRLARRSMRSEHAGHTLQATALVNEAFIRLVEMDVTWQNRAHFFAVASRLMRRILVDHARARCSQKRGGGAPKLSLDEELVLSDDRAAEMLELDDALDKLAAFDERKARIVELQFFSGLTYDETAEVLGVSPVTVHRDLKMAKAWLYNEFKRADAHP